MGNELRLEYWPLGEARRWDRNPKRHDIGSLVESIRRHGFRDAVIFDATLGALVAGNGRAEALAAMKAQGDDPPAGVKVGQGGEWLVPVQVGVDAASAAEAEAFALDHNNITLLGAEGITPWDVMRVWDEEDYLALLGELAREDALPVSVDGEDLDALLRVADPDELWRGMPEFEQEDNPEFHHIVVHFATRDDLNMFAELVGQNITEWTKYIWYPEQEDELRPHIIDES